MAETTRNEYQPDTVSPPGETLLETLEALGMTPVELAERTGWARETIGELVGGKTAITPETALQLERVLGIPAGFWNNRESLYREAEMRALTISQLCSSLPDLDPRSPEEIRGYDEKGGFR